MLSRLVAAQLGTYANAVATVSLYGLTRSLQDTYFPGIYHYCCRLALKTLVLMYRVMHKAWPLIALVY